MGHPGGLSVWWALSVCAPPAAGWMVWMFSPCPPRADLVVLSVFWSGTASRIDDQRSQDPALASGLAGPRMPPLFCGGGETPRFWETLDGS